MNADNVIKLNRNEEFTVIDCYKCGQDFAVPESIDRKWRRNGETFCCPRGHAQCYTDAPEVRYRNKVNELEDQLSELRTENAKLKLRVRPSLLSRIMAPASSGHRDD